MLRALDKKGNVVKKTNRSGRVGRQIKGSLEDEENIGEWHHHVAMRVGVEELSERTADVEVIFASDRGWDEANPEPYDVKFMCKSLGIRLREDDLKLHGDVGAMPYVHGTVGGKEWPRVGDMLFACGGEEVKGLSLQSITMAIMQGRRPVTLRFYPRELWFKDIEAASYDLVYPSAQLGVQISQSEEHGLPKVNQAPDEPRHTSKGVWDMNKPEIDDLVVAVKKLGEREFDVLLQHEDPYTRLMEVSCFVQQEKRAPKSKSVLLHRCGSSN